MSGTNGTVVEAQGRGYTLRGRRVEYVSPVLRGRSGDCSHVAVGVSGGSAAGNNNYGDMGVVPESPARDEYVIHKLGIEVDGICM